MSRTRATPTGAEEAIRESLERAEQSAASGRLREALEELQRAVRTYPFSATVHYNLGLAHLLILRRDLESDWQWDEDHLDNMDRYFAALAEFLVALGLDPAMEAARDNLRLLEQLRTWER